MQRRGGSRNEPRAVDHAARWVGCCLLFFLCGAGGCGGDQLGIRKGGIDSGGSGSGIAGNTGVTGPGNAGNGGAGSLIQTGKGREDSGAGGMGAGGTSSRGTGAGGTSAGGTGAGGIGGSGGAGGSSNLRDAGVPDVAAPDLWSAAASDTASKDAGTPDGRARDIQIGGFVEGTGECAAPCGAALLANGSTIHGAIGASLCYDPTSGDLTLRNTADPGSTNLIAMQFTYESDGHGYSTWASNGFQFAFTEGYAYVDGSSGLQTNVAMRAQMVNPKTGVSILVAFMFGTDSVTISDSHITACSPASATTCQNAMDCTGVNAGTPSVLSAGCKSCYDQFQACSDGHCANECPGQRGNVCMNCQTRAGCHKAFMSCSGLDYMPPATLQLPL